MPSVVFTLRNSYQAECDDFGLVYICRYRLFDLALVIPSIVGRLSRVGGNGSGELAGLLGRILFGNSHSDGHWTFAATLIADFGGDFEAWGRVDRVVRAGCRVRDGCGGGLVGHDVLGSDGCVTSLADVHICRCIRRGDNCFRTLGVGIVAIAIRRLSCNIGVNRGYRSKVWEVGVVVVDRFAWLCRIVTVDRRRTF